MTEITSGGDAVRIDNAIAGLVGGIDLGTVHDQRFYAIRANGTDIRFPFPAQPFTALINLACPLDDEILRNYASEVLSHGCVQAVCRGEEADRLVEIFDSLAEKNQPGQNHPPFTSMCIGEEPLDEAIQYFILPCGLAQTGLLMVIGDSDTFQSAIQTFISAGDARGEALGEAVYTSEDLVCFG